MTTDTDVAGIQLHPTTQLAQMTQLVEPSPKDDPQARLGMVRGRGLSCLPPPPCLQLELRALAALLLTVNFATESTYGRDGTPCRSPRSISPASAGSVQQRPCQRVSPRVTSVSVRRSVGGRSLFDERQPIEAVVC